MVNVHTSCLKEIEELSFVQNESQKKAAALKKEPIAKSEMEIPIVVGQKRTYVNANIGAGEDVEESKVERKEVGG